MGRVCPYCESNTLVLAADGVVMRCPSCGRSALPGEGDRPKPELESPPTRSTTNPSTAPNAPVAMLGLRRNRGAPGEIASWPAAGLALAASVLFYLLLGALPATRVSELFMDRGWVPYAITVISAWALFLLAAKLVRLRRERALLAHDWLGLSDGARILPNDAGAVLAALEARPQPVAGSFLARRLERSLRHFESRRRVVEVVEFLTTESRADEGHVDASYGLVRVFVWAVPTLGFIGTVIGIGGAVAGFSETLEAASSLDGMKESIGSVTGGLGVAFDTTLLALVMSILIMFPSNAVQRIEESFLSEVDDYCAEHLVRRLADDSELDAEQTAASESRVIDALAQRLVAAMRLASEREG